MATEIEAGAQYNTVDDALRVIKRTCTPEEFTTIEGVLSSRWHVEIPPPIVTENMSEEELHTEIMRLFVQIKSFHARRLVGDCINLIVAAAPLPPVQNPA